MQVNRICSRTVSHVTRDVRVLEAAQRMREEHVGDLIVVDKTEGRLEPVGILTDRDLVLAILAKDTEHVAMLDVGDVMSESLVTATEREDLTEVLRRMRSFGVRRIPITNDDGDLCGVLSADDVLAELSDEMSDLAELVSLQSHREREHRP
jgi:CBS domain-containing protein